VAWSVARPHSDVTQLHVFAVRDPLRRLVRSRVFRVVLLLLHR
jgi:hypothetical protein